MYGMRLLLAEVWATFVFDKEPTEQEVAGAVASYRASLAGHVEAMADGVASRTLWRLPRSQGVSVADVELHEIEGDEYEVAETWDDGGPERRTSVS